MKFLRNVLATIVGLFLFFFLIVVIMVAVASMASEEKITSIDDNSVLDLKLNRPISERESNNPLENIGIFPGAQDGGIGLVQLKEVINHAKTDNKIKGIYLETPFMMAGFATLDEIRKSLEDFKSSGKFIISSSDTYSEGAYYIASVADEVVLTPDMGNLEFDGINIDRMFFKGTLDKLGVEPYVFKVGEYKDYMEPWVRKDMSPKSREDLSHLINQIYDNILHNIAESRKLDYDEVKLISDSALVRKPEDAVRYKLVDTLAYKNDVLKKIRGKIGLDKDADINFVSYKKYKDSFRTTNTSHNKIAVVFASGEIVDGKGDQNTIGSETFTALIRKLRKEKDVKGIVLRVNSPGGSALASDLIWKEVGLAAAQKPVIASMSDYAASGGYYISVACDTIMASPSTLTGSIGVIGMMINAQKLLEDKLGVTSDNVETGKFSDLNNITRPKSEYELKMIQDGVNRLYDVFTTKAANGRHMDKQKLLTLASGRVWTGEDAVGNGLADMYGDLDDAIKLTAKKAGVPDDYRAAYYPVIKPPLEQLLNKLSDEYDTKMLQLKLGNLYPLVMKIQHAARLNGIQARFPYDMQFEF